MGIDATTKRHGELTFQLLAGCNVVTDELVAAFALCLFGARMCAAPPKRGDGHVCNGPGPCDVCGCDPDFEGLE
jgi:hypothetical protein